jgi:hypothetical protein
MRLKDPPNFNNGHNFNRRGIFLFVVFTTIVLGLFFFSRNGNYKGVDVIVMNIPNERMPPAKPDVS